MNYIKRLQAENRDLIDRLIAAVGEIDTFKAHLRSEKFTGVESDGGRKDWIATGDVFTRLQEIQSTLIG